MKIKNIFFIVLGLFLFGLLILKFSYGILAQEITLTPTLTPTPTPVNQEEIINPPPIGNSDYCESLTISKTTLNPGEDLTVTSKAKNSNIKTFSYRFYNIDNNNKAIKFRIGTVIKEYTRTITNSFTTNSNTIIVNFSQFDRSDLNWTSPVYGNPKPKNIKLAAFFTDLNNKTSKKDKKCEVNFYVNTIDPTPTPNLNCKCNTNNVCNNYCRFDKFPPSKDKNLTYSYPDVIKCNYTNLTTSATSDQKNAWCRRYYRTKGDADGDGKATFLDYFYYKTARLGIKLPPDINPDFNGDNFISDSDRNIVIKSILKK